MIFSAIGISHKESGLEIRELFYLDHLRKERLQDYTKHIPGGVLTLDTCNRTELYGFCHPEVLVKALCQSTNTSAKLFHRHGFVLHEKEAMHHLFKVGLGMDSQVLGDLQIIQQLKKAYKSVDHVTFSSEFHQLIQAVFRAHKRSRTETDFGKGNASVGFEATQQALSFFGNLEHVNILMIGAGKMGKVSCKNLLANGAKSITIVNRSTDRAKRIAAKYQIEAASYEMMHHEVKKADLIITATGASNPILYENHFQDRSTPTLVIDLSVPRNVHPGVSHMNHVTLIDMDSINRVNDAALQERKKALPILEKIIEEEIADYVNRIERSQYLLPRIKEIDYKISKIADTELDKVKNKLEPKVYDELEEITRRIKKKLMAAHIERLDEELNSINS